MSNTNATPALPKSAINHAVAPVAKNITRARKAMKANTNTVSIMFSLHASFLLAKHNLCDFFSNSFIMPPAG